MSHWQQKSGGDTGHRKVSLSLGSTKRLGDCPLFISKLYYYLFYFFGYFRLKTGKFLCKLYSYAIIRGTPVRSVVARAERLSLFLQTLF
jgi:hypothetical protein